MTIFAVENLTKTQKEWLNENLPYMETIDLPLFKTLPRLAHTKKAVVYNLFAKEIKELSLTMERDILRMHLNALRNMLNLLGIRIVVFAPASEANNENSVGAIYEEAGFPTIFCESIADIPQYITELGGLSDD